MCRIFRALIGYSPIEAMRLARLDRAALLLATGDEPVTLIAVATGFASVFHFSKAFKGAYGVGPAAFRATPDRMRTLPVARILKLNEMTDVLDRRRE